jgi:hypothetical protein
MENWRDVPGYSGIYDISDCGNIRRLQNKRILRKVNRNGYLVAHLSNRVAKSFYIHRLVAMAFIPNPDGLPQINHKNEIKTDNRAENLEWCTAKYNMNFGTRTQRMKKNRSFPVMQIDEYGVVISIYEGISEAERKTGINRPNICKCLKGKIKTAGGYKWEYAL